MSEQDEITREEIGSTPEGQEMLNLADRIEADPTTPGAQTMVFMAGQESFEHVAGGSEVPRKIAGKPKRVEASAKGFMSGLASRRFLKVGMVALGAALVLGVAPGVTPDAHAGRNEGAKVLRDVVKGVGGIVRDGTRERGKTTREVIRARQRMTREAIRAQKDIAREQVRALSQGMRECSKQKGPMNDFCRGVLHQYGALAHNLSR